jgi:hypothetical protein
MPFTIKTVCTKTLTIHRFYVEPTITIEELKAKILEKNRAPEGVCKINVNKNKYIINIIFIIFIIIIIIRLLSAYNM